MANRTLLRYFGLKQTAIVVFVGLGMLVHSPVPASAQPNPKSSADVTAQAEEFDRQKTELLKRLKELKSKIDGAGSIIDKKGNAAEAARESIQEMRAIVGPLLAAVADNGEVSQLSARTLKNAKDRKEMLERDTRFTPEERRRLVEAWAKRVQASEDATKELEKARASFLELMLTLQNKEALIGEWATTKAHDEVINTIRQLTKTLNDTSGDVSDFITWFERAGV